MQPQVAHRIAGADGSSSALKDAVKLQDGEVIDAAVMSVASLKRFFAEQIEDAKSKGVLFSLHLKATMMKVSDPIIFGHAVQAFYSNVFEKYAQLFDELGIDPKNGLGDLYARLDTLPELTKAEIMADIESLNQQRPAIAMVDSDRGITNLHVPSDIIIDASMPAAIRASGKMWGPDGKLHDMKAVIPDRSYSSVYQTVIDFCKAHGAFDVTTMGSVANVGLMAQKAEEYGSHDKTFEIPADGVVRVVDAGGEVLMEHAVEAGDIWRMCQTKDEPIRDWVRLAVSRARATGAATVFWLNSERAHDANLIHKVQQYLQDHDTSGLDIQILPLSSHAARVRASPARFGFHLSNRERTARLSDGPVPNPGTWDQRKMLSIVPLLAGGGLFETGRRWFGAANTCSNS